MVEKVELLDLISLLQTKGIKPSDIEGVNFEDILSILFEDLIPSEEVQDTKQERTPKDSPPILTVQNVDVTRLLIQQLPKDTQGGIEEITKRESLEGYREEGQVDLNKVSKGALTLKTSDVEVLEVTEGEEGSEDFWGVQPKEHRVSKHQTPESNRSVLQEGRKVTEKMKNQKVPVKNIGTPQNAEILEIPKEELRRNPQLRTDSPQSSELAPRREESKHEKLTESSNRLPQQGGKELKTEQISLPVKDEVVKEHPKNDTGRREEGYDTRKETFSPMNFSERREEQGVEEVEVLRKETQLPNQSVRQEVRQVNVRFEGAHIKFLFNRDKLNVDVRIQEQIERSLSYLDVQKLTRSLNTIGVSLEILRINGTELPVRDPKVSRREEKERFNIKFNDGSSEKTSHSSADSLDLNLLL